MSRNYICNPFFLSVLLMAGSSLSFAGDLQPEQDLFLAVNLDAEAPKAQDSKLLSDDSRLYPGQDADGDCKASGYQVTLFTPCEGEDAGRLWR